MFDFHLHSSVSHDSVASPTDIIRSAENRGLAEICFTDHYDFSDYRYPFKIKFDIESYNSAYDGLHSDKLLIRRGVEFGLMPWNREKLTELLDKRHFDFVIGSVHEVKDKAPYRSASFWDGRRVEEAFSEHLCETLECVKMHDGFDVLGHLTYISKSPCNLTRTPIRYEYFSDIIDEILKILAERGQGLEINTDGIDSVGDFLPSLDIIKRFRELGGEIITIGSDAHTAERVGAHINGALEIAKDIFGYVCTFDGRKPVFHKL